MKASSVESVGPDVYGMTTLSCQLEAATQDLDWMLAHFTFVADATTLADDCDIICSPALSVANYQGMSSPALSFLGDSPELLANYATFLVEPGSEVLLLVNEEQRPVVEAAFTVVESIPEWQMVFHGDPGELPETEARPLKRKHLPAMQTLAAAAGLTALPADPFAHGPAYGIWAGQRLVAMSTTRLSIPGAAEVGNIATAPNYRRKGYAVDVVAALLKELATEERVIFLMVYQANEAAIRLYEKLGFVRERPMYLMHCLVEGADEESTP